MNTSLQPTQQLSNAYEAVKGELPTSTTNKPLVKSNEFMKALAWYGKEDVRIIDANRPAITESTDAIVRVTGTTVCGSDLHLYHGEIFQLQKGDILGHEFMGVIDEAGPDVKIPIGTRCVASFQIACGQCEYCKKGLTSMCDTTNTSKLMEKLYGHKIAGMQGYSHFTGGFAGGQSQFVRVPFADVNLLPIPDDVPDDKALYLSDILSTSYHACMEADIKKGEGVGIWGCGPIGLLCIYWCKLLGAGRVIAVDNIPDRLEKAIALGAETINFDHQDVVKTIQKVTASGLEKCIDCAGFRYAKGILHKVERAVGLETDTSENINEMIMVTKKFGAIVLIADYAGFTNHLNIGAVMEKGIRLQGGGQAPVQKYWKEILETYLRPGKLDKALQTIVTHRFKIEEIPQIYKLFDKKQGGIIKTFVETPFSSAPSQGMPKYTDINQISTS